MIEELRELYAYNRWANHRVLDAVEALDEPAFQKDLGGSFPSVRDTLVHVLGAEWIWLARWRGSSPAGLPPTWDLSSLARIRARWREVEREQADFVEELGENDLERVVSYTNTKGHPFESTFAQMLRHVVNHSTYHRGQVVTMLRQLGADAVATDLIQYYRERAGDG